MLSACSDWDKPTPIDENNESIIESKPQDANVSSKVEPTPTPQPTPQPLPSVEPISTPQPTLQPLPSVEPIPTPTPKIEENTPLPTVQPTIAPTPVPTATIIYISPINSNLFLSYSEKDLNQTLKFDYIVQYYNHAELIDGLQIADTNQSIYIDANSSYTLPTVEVADWEIQKFNFTITPVSTTPNTTTKSMDINVTVTDSNNQPPLNYNLLDANFTTALYLSTDIPSDANLSYANLDISDEDNNTVYTQDAVEQNLTHFNIQDLDLTPWIYTTQLKVLQQDNQSLDSNNSEITNRAYFVINTSIEDYDLNVTTNSASINNISYQDELSKEAKVTYELNGTLYDTPNFTGLADDTEYKAIVRHTYTRDGKDYTYVAWPIDFTTDAIDNTPDNFNFSNKTYSSPNTSFSTKTITFSWVNTAVDYKVPDWLTMFVKKSWESNFVSYEEWQEVSLYNWDEIYFSGKSPSYWTTQEYDIKFWNFTNSFDITTRPYVAPNTAPTLSINNPWTATVGEEIIITATASDSDGTISKYEWKIDWVVVSGANSSTLKHTFGTAWNHTVLCTVTDNDWAIKTDTTTVDVEEANQAPTLTSVTASGNTVNYEWTFEWYEIYSIAKNADRNVTFTASWTDPEWSPMNIKINNTSHAWTSTNLIINLAQDEIAQFDIILSDWTDNSNQKWIKIYWT